MQYNPTAETVVAYYAKPTCRGLTTQGCCNSGGNFPSSRASCGGCPSCSYEGGWSGKGCYVDATKKFPVGEQAPFGSFGTFYIAKAGDDVYRLETNKDSGCYLDHIYACGQDEYIAKFKTIDGEE